VNGDGETAEADQTYGASAIEDDAAFVESEFRQESQLPLFFKTKTAARAKQLRSARKRGKILNWLAFACSYLLCVGR
jgi:hypothetical protein